MKNHNVKDNEINIGTKGKDSIMVNCFPTLSLCALTEHVERRNNE